MRFLIRSSWIKGVPPITIPLYCWSLFLCIWFLVAFKLPTNNARINEVHLFLLWVCDIETLYFPLFVFLCENNIGKPFVAQRSLLKIRIGVILYHTSVILLNIVLNVELPGNVEVFHIESFESMKCPARPVVFKI